jgi:hypothetical protein
MPQEFRRTSTRGRNLPAIKPGQLIQTDRQIVI